VQEWWDRLHAQSTSLSQRIEKKAKEKNEQEWWHRLERHAQPTSLPQRIEQKEKEKNEQERRRLCH
jgi:hypothetical protein